MRALTPRLLTAGLLVVLPLAACGDDDGNGSGSGSQNGSGSGTPPEDAVVVQAFDNLSFEPDTIEVEAGEISFVLEQGGSSSLQHTFVLEDADGVQVPGFKLAVSGGGDSDEGSIELEAGEYTFFCDVPAHRGGGMEGTLTVVG